MMSEGALNEPINPDYALPTAEITYEVEYQVPPGDWKSPGPFPDLALAEGLKEIIDGAGYKTRIIRVETIRSQMP